MLRCPSLALTLAAILIAAAAATSWVGSIGGAARAEERPPAPAVVDFAPDPTSVHHVTLPSARIPSECPLKLHRVSKSLNFSVSPGTLAAGATVPGVVQYVGEVLFWSRAKRGAPAEFDLSKLNLRGLSPRARGLFIGKVVMGGPEPSEEGEVGWRTVGFEFNLHSAGPDERISFDLVIGGKTYSFEDIPLPR